MISGDRRSYDVASAELQRDGLHRKSFLSWQSLLESGFKCDTKQSGAPFGIIKESAFTRGSEDRSDPPPCVQQCGCLRHVSGVAERP